MLLEDDRLARARRAPALAAEFVEDEESVLDPAAVDTAVGLLRELAAWAREFSGDQARTRRRVEAAANRPSREPVARCQAARASQGLQRERRTRSGSCR